MQIRLGHSASNLYEHLTSAQTSVQSLVGKAPPKDEDVKTKLEEIIGKRLLGGTRHAAYSESHRADVKHDI
jgi:hypothetical protein